MNQFLAIGNLTRDPETTVTTSGKTRCRFTLALNRAFKSQNGEREADFVQFTCFDKTAENCGKYLTKGRKAGVRAHVRTGSYEKDGKKIFTTEFIADEVEFLSSATGSGNGTEAPSGQAVDEFAPVDVPDDELPF